MSTQDVKEPGEGPDMPEPAPGEHPIADAPPNTESSDLQKERDDYHERLMRKTAEFDNYRKRIDRERRELNEWAAADLLGELLAVIDDLDRALAAEAPEGSETYRAGVELIYRQLQDLLRKRGVTPIEVMGADFDPHVHQAVAYDEEPGAREGEIVGELRKGYKLGDRLLRPAMVKVAKAS